MNNKKILFIASYPNSGNPFMRALVSSLIYSKDGIFNFGLFNHISLIDTNPFYDFVKIINEKDFFNLDNIACSSKYWQLAQKKSSELTPNFIFKTHAANLMYINKSYTSPENCLGVIYIVRDPRSIVPSYSYHLNISEEDIFKIITNKKSISLNPKENICVPLSSWDIHIKSWEMLKCPKIFIKFEDMVRDTKGTIKKCIDFLKFLNLEFTCDNQKIENIYQSTKFNKLKKLEDISGYRIGKDKNFFRKGEIENDDLNQDIKNKLKLLFQDKMRELNYI